MSESDIKAFNPKGIILSGGPNSVYESDTPIAPPIVFELGIPVLGICYGMQTMAEQLGGKVQSSDVHEFGYAQVKVEEHPPCFTILKIMLMWTAAARCWMYG